MSYDVSLSIMREFDRINEIVETTSTVDFRIQSYDSANLMITGSFDFCYYHEVEILFSKVSYFSLPTDFRYPKFRIATIKEIDQIKKNIAIGTEKTIFCIEAEPTCDLEKSPYFVVAESVSFNEGRVFYYEREDLKEGERIASWVKASN